MKYTTPAARPARRARLRDDAAGWRKAASVFSVHGFYVYRGDTCHVVVSDHFDHVRTLGHEFKHCVDGEFHDERGLWRQRSG